MTARGRFLAAVALLAVLEQLAACAHLGPLLTPPGAAAAPQDGQTLADAVLAYVGQVCALPAAERAPLLAELGEAARPAVVTVDCGPR